VSPRCNTPLVRRAGLRVGQILRTTYCRRMRKWGILVAAAVVLSSIAACSASPGRVDPVGQSGTQQPPIDLVASEVSQDSTPLFLDAPRSDLRDIPVGISSAFGLDSATVRYQGQWHGQKVYLTARGNSVSILQGKPGDAESWGISSSAGNYVLGTSVNGSSNGLLQYLPAGNATIPTGWTALSEFIIVR
jgi:hypothetical protein